jgi:L-aminopeptidase/D-esterase-like protein
VSAAARAGDRLTDVAGITVGHHHRLDDDVVVGGDRPGDRPGSGWAAGTTVVRIAGPDPRAAVDVRGGGPGTRETDLLDPSNTVTVAHAIVLTGGSAYGLAAADGVMAELERAGVGLPMDIHGHVVPIVPAAVIFDLPVGGWDRRPDAGFGAAATRAAAQDFAIGSVGAGTGARAGGLKGGVGTASRLIEAGPAAGVTVGALIVANPVGTVIDPATGLPWGAPIADLERFGLRQPTSEDIAAVADIASKATVLNTTIGVVATDAALSPASLRRMAVAAHDGLARAIVPVHSPLDGDTIFAVSTGARPVEPSPLIPPGMNPEAAVLTQVAQVAAEVTRDAVWQAVIAARPVAGIPTYADVVPSALR